MSTPPEAVITSPSGASATTIYHGTYSSLVLNDADLVGHVAYALYKRDKLKFCEKFKVKHSRPASPDELAIFIDGCNLETRLQGYRAEAEGLLETMTEYQLEDAIEEVKKEATKELARKLSASKSWGRSIAEALLGSVVVAIVWGALVLVLYTNKVGVDRMAKDILNVDINSAASVPRPPESAASK